MIGITRHRIGALAVAGLVATGVVAFSMTASGQTTPTPPEATKPVLVKYGTLKINLTGTPSYTLFNAAGDPTGAETIVINNPCASVAAGSGNFLKVTPNPDSPTTLADAVQVRNNAFGVNTGNTSCGSSAAAVFAQTEQLKVELGPGIPSTVYIKSASLKVTQIKSGNLRVKLGGGTLGSAISITQSPQTVPIAPTINTAADLFRSITLASTSAKDNEGLSLYDGTSFDLVTLDSTFEVAVNCGQQVTQLGSATDIATKAVFFRGENAAKQTTQCVDVGVSIDTLTLPNTSPAPQSNDPRVVFWNNSRIGADSSTQAVNGTVTINWVPVPAAEASRLNRQIDYDGPGPAGFTSTLWCASFSSTTDPLTGKVTLNGVLPDYSGPGSITVGGFQKAPWCLVSDTRVLNGGTISQTEVLFGSGDPYRG